jgi:hypothetical protein
MSVILAFLTYVYHDARFRECKDKICRVCKLFVFFNNMGGFIAPISSNLEDQHLWIYIINPRKFGT